MARPKISVVIPYKRRLETLSIVFASLAEQTLGRPDLEVVVGALEYAPEYLELCREYAGRLRIVSVLVDEEWNFSRARNIPLRQASGEVVVFLDADLALPAGCLESLYNQYFADGQEICVLGQQIGYDSLAHYTPESVTLQPWEYYRKRLAELEAGPPLRDEQRWQFEPLVLPWTIVFGSFIALPAATVHRHELFFDENFHGWGGEDQEWGYRVAATGTPIVRGERVFGVSLPHVRGVPGNLKSFDANKRYFLAKWPTLDVELYRAFKSWEANRRYHEVRAALARVLQGTAGHGLGVVRGTVDGTDLLVVGALLDANGRACDPALEPLLDQGFPTQTLPLVGLALPIPDAAVARCRILPRVLALPEPYRTAVRAEAARVAGTVVEHVEERGE